MRREVSPMTKIGAIAAAPAPNACEIPYAVFLSPLFAAQQRVFSPSKA
jgi:hypothetical protein